MFNRPQPKIIVNGATPIRSFPVKYRFAFHRVNFLTPIRSFPVKYRFAFHRVNFLTPIRSFPVKYRFAFHRVNFLTPIRSFFPTGQAGQEGQVQWNRSSCMMCCYSIGQAENTEESIFIVKAHPTTQILSHVDHVVFVVFIYFFAKSERRRAKSLVQQLRFR